MSRSWWGPAFVRGRLASNQAQPLLIWWRRDLGLGASKNRRLCNHYVFSSCEPKFGLQTASFTREPTSGCEQNVTTHTGARACWQCWTPRRHWCSMSFVLDGSSLRCRGVLNQLFVAVNFATPSHWKPSCLGRTSFRCWSINWSVSCFLLLWQPKWWHTGNVKKKKTQALWLTPFLPLYNAIELGSFLCWKKKNKK